MMGFYNINRSSVMKSGSDTNEDFVSVRKTGIAISDGAGSSFYPHLFSKRLAIHAAGTGEIPSGQKRFLEWIKKPANRWFDDVSKEPDLGLIAKMKLKEGSHAACCLLRFEDQSLDQDDLRSFKVSAVGDSCFFHVRKNELLTSFPLQRSRQFGRTPPLISTNENYNRKHAVPNVVHYSGCFQEGDFYLLATDAFSQHFLEEVEMGRTPWETLLSLKRGGFHRLIKRLRKSDAIDNDDTTVTFGEIKKSQEKDNSQIQVKKRKTKNVKNKHFGLARRRRCI